MLRVGANSVGLGHREAPTSPASLSSRSSLACRPPAIGKATKSRVWGASRVWTLQPNQGLLSRKRQAPRHTCPFFAATSDCTFRTAASVSSVRRFKVAALPEVPCKGEETSRRHQRPSYAHPSSLQVVELARRLTLWRPQIGKLRDNRNRGERAMRVLPAPGHTSAIFIW